MPEASDLATVPVPLAQIAADLSARAESLASQVTTARTPPPPAAPPTQAAEAESRRTREDWQRKHPGVPPEYAAVIGPERLPSHLGEINTLRKHWDLKAADNAITAAQAALEAAPAPETLPDDLADLTGSPIAQALLLDGLLASYDAERDDRGDLTTRAAQKAYARLAARRDDLDGPVRDHLAALTDALDLAAEGAASHLAPRAETPAAPPERTTSSWV